MTDLPSVAHRLNLVLGDLTKVPADALVNAANSSLLGGGGVDGAIHRAAGHGLYLECLGLGGCEPGEAKLTSGHDLKARYVIHTVGPVWSGGRTGEEPTLASCYQRSLALAAGHGVRTLAFPSIATGVYAFPLDRAARIAVREILAFLGDHDLPERVTMVCFDPETLRAYRKALAEAGGDDALKGGTGTVPVRLQEEAQLRDLEDALARDPAEASLEQEMTGLSLAFGLLTRFTAWLAVDEAAAVNPGGVLATLLQPVERPRGWQPNPDEAPVLGIGSTAFAYEPRVPSIIRMSHARIFGGTSGVRERMESMPSAPMGEASAGQIRTRSTCQPERAVPLAEELLRFLGDHDFKTPTLEDMAELARRCEEICGHLKGGYLHGAPPDALCRACSFFLRLDREAGLTAQDLLELPDLLSDLEQKLRAFLKAFGPRPPRKFWGAPGQGRA